MVHYQKKALITCVVSELAFAALTASFLPFSLKARVVVGVANSLMSFIWMVLASIIVLRSGSDQPLPNKEIANFVKIWKLALESIAGRAF